MNCWKLLRRRARRHRMWAWRNETNFFANFGKLPNWNWRFKEWKRKNPVQLITLNSKNSLKFKYIIWYLSLDFFLNINIFLILYILYTTCMWQNLLYRTLKMLIIKINKQNLFHVKHIVVWNLWGSKYTSQKKK